MERYIFVLLFFTLHVACELLSFFTTIYNSYLLALQVVVIGGGYIGMECTAALAMNDVPITMVFPEKHLMSRLLNPEAGKFYEDVYISKGVTLMKEQLATSFEGAKGKVSVNLFMCYIMHQYMIDLRLQLARKQAAAV